MSLSIHGHKDFSPIIQQEPAEEIIFTAFKYQECVYVLLTVLYTVVQKG